jgi:hypothetical protein
MAGYNLFRGKGNCIRATSTVGKLGLTPTEEDQIVAFLKTLTDGFTTSYPDSNRFTGSCP